MNGFDKVCAVLAFPLGVVLVVLGILGAFAGCQANFTLPPVLGAVPALVGWGIVRAILIAWRDGERRGARVTHPRSAPRVPGGGSDSAAAPEDGTSPDPGHRA